MKRIADRDAVAALRSKGFVTRYKGYFVNVFDAKSNVLIASLKSANGGVSEKALKALVA